MTETNTQQVAQPDAFDVWMAIQGFQTLATGYSVVKTLVQTKNHWIVKTPSGVKLLRRSDDGVVSFEGAEYLNNLMVHRQNQAIEAQAAYSLLIEHRQLKD